MESPAVRMLTGTDLVLVDGDISGTLTPMQRALLVALALHPGLEVSRDWLADLLWPETDQSTARQRLRGNLYNVRKALQELPVLAIEANREAISLTVDPMDIDVHQFESAATSDHPNTRTEGCRFYAGDLLSRFPPISSEFDQFLENRRTGLRSIAMSLFVETIQSARSRGDMAGFEHAYQRTVQIDPTNSAAVVLAMETLAEQGLRERMEQEYNRFCTAYADAFDASPPETVAEVYKTLDGETRVKPAVATNSATQPAALPKAPKRNVPGRTASRHNSGLVILIVVLATALMGTMLLIYRSSPAPTEGMVILLHPYDIADEACAVDNIAPRYRLEMRDNLEKLEGVSLFVSPISGSVAGLGGQALELQQDVTCSGELIRATLTLSRVDVAKIIWIGRYDATFDTIGKIAAAARSDLSSAISAIQK